MARVTIKRGNDQTVWLTGLKKITDGLYLNGATATASLYDSKGNAVTAFQNVTMVYKVASDGDYGWAIEGPSMMIPKGVDYQLVITAVESGLNYRAVHPVSVVD